MSSSVKPYYGKIVCNHGRWSHTTDALEPPVKVRDMAPVAPSPCCGGKCPGNTIFCSKRTGKDTVLVVNAHNKGRPDEHCCLKLPERDRKGKKTGKYILSCVTSGYNTTWPDANVSGPGP